MDFLYQLFDYHIFEHMEGIVIILGILFWLGRFVYKQVIKRVNDMYESDEQNKDLELSKKAKSVKPPKQKRQKKSYNPYSSAEAYPAYHQPKYQPSVKRTESETEEKQKIPSPMMKELKLDDKKEVVRGIVLSEILGPPKAHTTQGKDNRNLQRYEAKDAS